MVDNRYTILVGNEQFRFTRDQLESDPGNYFATYFFGEFAEASQGAKELVVEKDVHLFRLIQAHLRGYDIFPLPDAAIPPYMTKEVAIKNLRRDAQFYCLEKLEEKLKEFELMSPKGGTGVRRDSPSAKRYKFGAFQNGWRFQDIGHDGYWSILNKLDPGDMIVPPAHMSTDENIPVGFSVIFYWQSYTKAHSYRWLALFVSDD